MKEFLKSLLTNRFGLIMGTLNLCCIPLYGLFSFSYSTSVSLRHYFIAANSPAIILSFIFGSLIEAMFPVFKPFSMKILLIPIFILLQWIFIGFSSKIIAEKIRSNFSN